MPKENINYSNTIIYKIYCKNQNINDIYVGYTTNFPKRKHYHKKCYNNDNKNKIYEIIKKNGGWDNWDMIEIANYNCKNQTEALIKQEYHYQILNDKINNKINDKKTENYNFIENNNFFICECGRQYKYRQGLFVHKKKCNMLTNEIKEEKSVIITLLEQNNQLQNQIIELCKEKNYLTNINNINSNNKTFNLNVFLNETCKDAMNIMDFVDSIKLQLSDLENVGKIGYIEGISNIITSNLKALDITQRPIHCTDKKRDVIYVKDENKWERDEEKNKLRNVIKKVAFKNQRVLPQFKEKYPDCNTSVSNFSDQYNKIIIEAMGGYGENDLEKEDKIIKNIAKNVLIDK
jgi:hypothetical protein